MINAEQNLTFQSRLLKKTVLHPSNLYLSYLGIYQHSSVLHKQNNKGSGSSPISSAISLHCVYVCRGVLSTEELLLPCNSSQSSASIRHDKLLCKIGLLLLVHVSMSTRIKPFLKEQNGWGWASGGWQCSLAVLSDIWYTLWCVLGFLQYTDMHIKFTVFLVQIIYSLCIISYKERKAIVFNHEYSSELILNSLTVHITWYFFN